MGANRDAGKEKGAREGRLLQLIVQYRQTQRGVIREVHYHNAMRHGAENVRQEMRTIRCEHARLFRISLLKYLGDSVHGGASAVEHGAQHHVLGRHEWHVNKVHGESECDVQTIAPLCNLRCRSMIPQRRDTSDKEVQVQQDEGGRLVCVQCMHDAERYRGFEEERVRHGDAAIDSERALLIKSSGDAQEQRACMDEQRERTTAMLFALFRADVLSPLHWVSSDATPPQIFRAPSLHDTVNRCKVNGWVSEVDTRNVGARITIFH